MSQTKSAVSSRNLGDVAVDGLLAGLAAGIVMALTLVVLGPVYGDDPAMVLARFDLGSPASSLTGALAHLAVSGVYGLVFGMAWAHRPLRRLPGMLTGALYGLALWTLAETTLLPGTQSALLAIPIWVFALAHLVYGVILGTLREGTGSRVGP